MFDGGWDEVLPPIHEQSNTDERLARADLGRRPDVAEDVLQRVESDRLTLAACCADCGRSGRTNPLDRMRYHAKLAQRFAVEATRHADEAARAADRACRGNIIATAILVPLSLIVLVLAGIALANG